MAHQALSIVKLSGIVVLAIIEIMIRLLKVPVEKRCVLGIDRGVHDRVVSRQPMRVHLVSDLGVTAGRWGVKTRLGSSTGLPLLNEVAHSLSFLASRSIDGPWPQVGTVRSIAICYGRLELFVFLEGGLMLRLSRRSWWLVSLLLHNESFFAVIDYFYLEIYFERSKRQIRKPRQRIFFTTKL